MRHPEKVAFRISSVKTGDMPENTSRVAEGFENMAAMTPESDIPDKLYFKIGEAAQIAGVPTYVLRFWETEFPRINPKRTPSGQRLYRRQDVELIMEIKRLLYENKFTIQGAREYLKTATRKKEGERPHCSLKDIQKELESIRKLLS